MADQLDRELHELLKSLNVEQESSGTPEDRITVACLYHKADRRDWQRLEQHLEAVQWQIQKHCILTCTSDEGNPKEPSHIAHMKKAAEHIENAHILLVGLSVDMQLLLQQQPHLYETLQSKLAQAKQVRNAWGQPPYVAGIRMKETLWEDSELYGMEFLPRFTTLANQHHKDATCVEIARQVRDWISEILDERNYRANRK